MWLWRLKSPKNCSWQLETQDSQWSGSNLSSSPKAGENQCPSLKTGKESKFSLIPPFILFRFSRDCMGPTHTGEGNPVQSKDSNICLLQKHPYRHTQDNVWLGNYMAQSRWHRKLTVTFPFWWTRRDEQNQHWWCLWQNFVHLLICLLLSLRS